MQLGQGSCRKVLRRRCGVLSLCVWGGRCVKGCGTCSILPRTWLSHGQWGSSILLKRLDASRAQGSMGLLERRGDLIIGSIGAVRHLLLDDFDYFPFFGRVYVQLLRLDVVSNRLVIASVEEAVVHLEKRGIRMDIKFFIFLNITFSFTT